MANEKRPIDANALISNICGKQKRMLCLWCGVRIARTLHFVAFVRSVTLPRMVTANMEKGLQKMADRKRCCCNCGNDIRTKDEKGNVECHCAIDGYYIGYVECFEHWCRRWKKDHTFDGERREGE